MPNNFDYAVPYLYQPICNNCILHPSCCTKEQRKYLFSCNLNVIFPSCWVSCQTVNAPLRMAFIFQPELSAPVLNSTCMICRLQDPMSMRLCCSLSTLSFCHKLKNFQLVEGPFIETWIIRFAPSTL